MKRKSPPPRPRTRQHAPSKVAIYLNDEMRHYVEAAVSTGLYGTTPGEVCRHFVHREIERLIREAITDQRKPEPPNR